MSASWILHRLYSQDPSSLDFLRHLSSLIRHDEEEHFLTSLQGSESTRLVDFLDGVRTLPLVSYPATKWAPQALSAISANHKVSRQCLRKLQAICDRSSTLPSSYVLSDEVATVGGDPIPLGENTELLEGSCGDKKVSVKRPTATSADDETHRKVCVRHDASLSHPFTNACGVADVLQRSRYLEKLEAPEHRPFRRRHNESFANCLRVDAERDPDGVRPEKPRHEPDRPCKSFSAIACDR
jgi:hypothetical protein